MRQMSQDTDSVDQEAAQKSVAQFGLEAQKSVARFGLEAQKSVAQFGLKALPHFPTDARGRQEALVKSGHVAKKRPQNVEQHFDDCGEDIGPLTLLADSCELSVEEELACVVDWHFGLNG